VSNTCCWPVSGCAWGKVSAFHVLYHFHRPVSSVQHVEDWKNTLLYKYSCPVCGRLYPYRHLWPVCRCLSLLPALFTSMWICFSVRSRCCAHCRTEASEAKSSFTTTNWPAPSVSFVSCRMSAAATSAFFRSLQAMITRAPVVQKYHVGYLQQVNYRHTGTCAVFGYLEVRCRWNWVCGNYIKHLYTVYSVYRGRDNRYGLDGPGIETQCGGGFPPPPDRP
jgi:hypothetical protein